MESNVVNQRDEVIGTEREFGLSLDELLALNCDELERYYCHASVPKLNSISGDLRGRMLAIARLAEPWASATRMLAGSDQFPWRGKSFYPQSESRGEGKNRVIQDRWKLFRFETFLGRSRAGEFDAVQLDYDLPENPFFIRAIKDEIRQLRPGLFLGQAYLQLGSQTHLALYFGLTSD
jgi:hypothetical protein